MKVKEGILSAEKKESTEFASSAGETSGSDKAQSEKSSILAVIPAWNEARTIGPIVEAVRAKLPVLVVDDGSTDATADCASKAGAEVISHPANLRKGAALKTAFAWAVERGYEAVVTMDADGQHDPADLDKLLNESRHHRAALIIGEREFSRMPWPNRFTTPLGSRILSWALGIRVTDNQSGFRLLTKPLLERMNLRSNGYEMEVEMIGEAIRLKMPIAWVPIRTIYLPDRQSGFRPFVDTLRFLSMVWSIWRQRVNRDHKTGEGED
jgi:glycosyltransferase involved in cell wall biosynthesis